MTKKQRVLRDPGILLAPKHLSRPTAASVRPLSTNSSSIVPCIRQDEIAVAESWGWGREPGGRQCSAVVGSGGGEGGEEGGGCSERYRPHNKGRTGEAVFHNLQQ